MKITDKKAKAKEYCQEVIEWVVNYLGKLLKINSKLTECGGKEEGALSVSFYIQVQGKKVHLCNIYIVIDKRAGEFMPAHDVFKSKQFKIHKFAEECLGDEVISELDDFFRGHRFKNSHR